MASFRTTAGQYLSAVSGLHALSETMNGLAAAAMRLECTFHFKLVSLFLKWSWENRTGFS
jgi:hypothetical protein